MPERQEGKTSEREINRLVKAGDVLGKGSMTGLRWGAREAINGEDIVSFFSGLGLPVHEAGRVLEEAKQAILDVAGGAGGALQNTAKEVTDFGREKWETVNRAIGLEPVKPLQEIVTIVTPEGFVSQADYNAVVGHTLRLQKKVNDLIGQNYGLSVQVDDLQKQLAEVKSTTLIDMQDRIDVLAQQNQDLSKQIDNLQQQMTQAQPAETVLPETPIIQPETPALVSLDNVLGQKITIAEGSSFWQSINIDPKYLAPESKEGWVNPENGTSQANVLRGLLSNYGTKHGRDLSLIQAGTYTLKELIGDMTTGEEDMFQKVLATKNIGEYIALVDN